MATIMRKIHFSNWSWQLLRRDWQNHQRITFKSSIFVLTWIIIDVVVFGWTCKRQMLCKVLFNIVSNSFSNFPKHWTNLINMKLEMYVHTYQTLAFSCTFTYTDMFNAYPILIQSMCILTFTYAKWISQSVVYKYSDMKLRCKT